MSIRCITTGDFYHSPAKAAKSLNVKKGDIELQMAGKIKHAGGYRFEECEKPKRENNNKRPDLYVRVKDKQTGRIFPSIGAAAKHNRMHYSTMSKALIKEKRFMAYFGEPEKTRPDFILCVQTGDWFPSVADAASYLSISTKSIYRVLKGEAKNVKGFTFELKRTNDLFAPLY